MCWESKIIVWIFRTWMRMCLLFGEIPLLTDLVNKVKERLGWRECEVDVKLEGVKCDWCWVVKRIIKISTLSIQEYKVRKVQNSSKIIRIPRLLNPIYVCIPFKPHSCMPFTHHLAQTDDDWEPKSITCMHAFSNCVTKN
jgi:hypothetical protein